MSSRHFTGYALLTALIVALAGGAAQAVVFEISTKNRNYCCDSVFIAGVPQPAKGYHTVVATASAGPKGNPITLKFGHAINFYRHDLRDQPPGWLAQDQHRDGEPLQCGWHAREGRRETPANFSFCPKGVGLPIPGAGCVNPALATPTTQGFNGQVKVTTGPNKFGGTMQILAGAGGIGGSKFFVYRFLGPMMTQLPAALVFGGFNDSPIGAMTPGKAVTVPNPSMNGYPPDFDTNSFPGQKLWQQGAGPFTTGLVTLKITMQAGLPVRSVMLQGYDNRTAGGKGNVQLVSGILANGFNGAAPGGTPIGHKMRIQFVPGAHCEPRLRGRGVRTRPARPAPCATQLRNSRTRRGSIIASR